MRRRLLDRLQLLQSLQALFSTVEPEELTSMAEPCPPIAENPIRWSNAQGFPNALLLPFWWPRIDDLRRLVLDRLFTLNAFLGLYRSLYGIKV